MALIALLGLVAGTPLLATASLGTPTPSQVQGSGFGDIPPEYYADYQKAASRFGPDWAVLAAVGKIECDHGRLQAAGCNPSGSVNEAGAVGPMQFLASTWRRGAPLGTSPPPGPATQTTPQGYATDGDGDSIADIWNPADAITAAARYLAANGAPGDYRRALFAYNHADWYVDRVLEQARAYRDAATTIPADAPAPAANDPVSYAQRYLGSAYVYGGNHASAALQLDPASSPALQVGVRDGRPGFFDCSSLTSWAFAKTRRLFIGGTSEEQWRLAQERSLVGQALVRVDPPPGGFLRDDLLFFEATPSGPGHVALAIDSRRMIESPHTGANVRISLITAHTGLVGVARYPQPTTPTFGPKEDAQ